MKNKYCELSLANERLNNLLMDIREKLENEISMTRGHYAKRRFGKMINEINKNTEQKMDVIKREIELPYTTTNEHGYCNYMLVIECPHDEAAEYNFTLWEHRNQNDQVEIATSLNDLANGELKNQVQGCIDEANSVIDSLNCHCESCIEAKADGHYKYLYYDPINKRTVA